MEKEVRNPNCPGDGVFACVDGWLYSSIGMMIFPTNRKCPLCYPPPPPSNKPEPSDDLETTG